MFWSVEERKAPPAAALDRQPAWHFGGKPEAVGQKAVHGKRQFRSVTKATQSVEAIEVTLLRALALRLPEPQ